MEEEVTGSGPRGIKPWQGQISREYKRRAMDNIMIERLWRSLKYEDIYLKDYETVEELVVGLRAYFEYYNNERSHHLFDGNTPAEV